MILDKFPSIDVFYRDYWGRKPFVVRGAIAPEVFDGLVDGDHLAGLAMEEDIRSRLVITADEGGRWACEHGPFEAERFAALGDKNWSLLVQNVEQYHRESAQLLREFAFAPRWMMDDIMVSYSAKGGSVGPHTDSYHVFLVQGEGKRQWRVSDGPIKDAAYVERADLKVLKDGFEGPSVEVSMGDVIYLPPHFAHEGVTIENALTFSVGFLGPQLSDMLVEYGAHLEAQEGINKRYGGEGLSGESSGFCIEFGAVGDVRRDLIAALQSDDFGVWMAEYFSRPSHDEAENIERREGEVSEAEVLDLLRGGVTFVRPDHVKFAVSFDGQGGACLAVYGEVVSRSPTHKDLIMWLNDHRRVSMGDVERLGGVDLVVQLYNMKVLISENENLY